MLDKLWLSSRLRAPIEKFIVKTLGPHFNANQLTLAGLTLGIIAAILLCILGAFHLVPHSQRALIFFASDLRFSGWKTAWMQSSSPDHLFNWSWGYGDTLLLLTIICLFFSFIFDICDGIIARKTSPTLFGGIFDIFSDRFVELAILLGITSLNPSTLLWPALIATMNIVLCITIFLLIGGAAAKIKVEDLSNSSKLLYYATGIMERSETILFLFAMILIWPLQQILLWIFAGLIFITAIQRFIYAYRIFIPIDKIQLQKEEKERQKKE